MNRESFTRIDIVEMIRRGEIRWKSLLGNI